MPSMITSERKEVLLRVGQDAGRKGMDETIDELTKSGVLHEGNVQRVQAQGNKIVEAVKVALKIVVAELAENIVGCLKRIFADRVVEMPETDGKETLAGAADVFTGGIYGAVSRKPGKPTKKMVIALYEMILDATYRTIFGGFGENLKRLCWTESQIVAFCRDSRNREYLRAGGYGTFFLFEGEDGGFYVAYVIVFVVGRLAVRVRPLGDDGIWRAECRRCVVVPQLTA